MTGHSGDKGSDRTLRGKGSDGTLREKGSERTLGRTKEERTRQGDFKGRRQELGNYYEGIS